MKSFCKKIIGAGIILIAILAACSKNVEARIPKYKGLYTIFLDEKGNGINTIGIGQALRYSNWLENVYTYLKEEKSKIIGQENLQSGQGAKKEEKKEQGERFSAERVISILWDKRLSEVQPGQERFTDTGNFVLSNKFPAREITPSDLGKIIKYLKEFDCEGKNSGEQDKIKKEIEKKRGILIGLGKKEESEMESKNKGKKGEKKKLEENKAKHEVEKKLDPESCSRALSKALIERKTRGQTRELIIALEDLKCDAENFVPEMAEAILWAFFESKTNWGDKEFKECLEEIDPKLVEKLKDKYEEKNFDLLKQAYKNENITNTILESLINKKNYNSQVYDNMIYYLIESKRNAIVPKQALQTKLQSEHPKTLEKSEGFPTCFESAILDILSILLFNQKTRQYDVTILPDNIQKESNFKVFSTLIFSESLSELEKKLEELKKQEKDSKDLGEQVKNWNEEVKKIFNNLDIDKFISHEDINKKIKEWTNLVSNQSDLKYFKKEEKKDKDDKTYFLKYDLVPCIENFVKVLNKFFGLGFEIIDEKDTFKVKFKHGENLDKNLDEKAGVEKELGGEKQLEGQAELVIDKSKIESWQKLFDLIGKKLSTNTREVKLLLKDVFEGVKFEKVENKIDNSSICLGSIKIMLDEVSLYLILKSFGENYGHAYVVCPARDVVVGFEIDYRLKEILKKDFDKLENLMPATILLGLDFNFGDNNKKLNNILCYLPQFKDQNLKIKFLKNIFGLDEKELEAVYKDKILSKLVSNLIKLLPANDENFIFYLDYYFKDFKGSGALYWQDEIENKIVEYIAGYVNGIKNMASKDYFQFIRFVSVKNSENYFKKLLALAKIENITEKIDFEKFMDYFLKDGKADVNIRDGNGNTLLLLAVKRNDKDFVSILIKRKEKLFDFGDNYGILPIHFAVKYEEKEIVSMLLEYFDEISVDRQDKDGNTPFHLAAYYLNKAIRDLEKANKYNDSDLEEEIKKRKDIYNMFVDYWNKKGSSNRHNIYNNKGKLVKDLLYDR